MKTILSFGVVVALASTCMGVVECGKNLLVNGRFEADQLDMPPFWSAFSPERIKYHQAGGPDGRPYVTLVGDADGKPADTTIRQFGHRFSSNGTFRVSAKIRTRGFKAKSSGFGFVNHGWTHSAMIHGFPADTGGEWRLLTKTVSGIASSDGMYSALAYANHQVGEVDVADFEVVAIDEAAASGTDYSALMKAQINPRIVPFAPLLWKIPSNDRRVTFRFFGRLAGAIGDYDFRLAVEGMEGAVKTLALTRTDITMELPRQARLGWLVASVVERSTGKTVVSDRFSFAVRERDKIDTSSHRRLNNLATEVLAAEWTSVESPREYKFSLVRDGWAFIRVEGESAGGFSVLLDGTKVIEAETPRHETFRNLLWGEHTIVICGAGRGKVVVRAIADIFNYCPGSQNQIKENGSYDWNFQERYVLPAVTTQNGGSIAATNFPGFRARGYRWIDNMSSTGATLDELVARLEKTRGMNDPRFAGVSCDEQFFTRPNALDIFTQAIRRYDLKYSPEREIYSWIVGKPLSSALDQAFFSAAVNVSRGNGKLLLEAYCRTQEHEEAARTYLKAYVADTLNLFRKLYPLSIASTCVAFGNFNQVPFISLVHHPEVDFKYFLDMQLNLAANDPSCRDLGSIGYWGSYYANEEMHRWSFALMRHYVVEGQTEMLSKRYGYRYEPGLLKDGDFRQGLSQWRTKGRVSVDSMKDFAKTSQNRWCVSDGVGDAFAVLERGTNEVAHLGQVAQGLVPGRTYVLQFASFDVDDVKAKRVAPRRFGIGVKFDDGAEICRERTWTHVDDRDGNRYKRNSDDCARINLHHVTFTAKSSTVAIAIDNAEAKPGEKLGVNYVSLNPYFDIQ